MQIATASPGLIPRDRRQAPPHRMRRSSSRYFSRQSPSMIAVSSERVAAWRAMISARFTSGRWSVVGRRLGVHWRQPVEPCLHPFEYFRGMRREDLMVLALERAESPLTRKHSAPGPVRAVHHLRDRVDSQHLYPAGIRRRIIGADRPLHRRADIRRYGELPRIADVERDLLQPLSRAQEPARHAVSEQLRGFRTQLLAADFMTGESG